MRLTDQQIRDTVSAMTMSDFMKSQLLHQCLDRHLPSARFIITAAWQKRQRAAEQAKNDAARLRAHREAGRG